MRAGAYLVYIFFLLLFAWIGQRVATSNHTLLAKVLITLGIVIGYLIVETEAKAIWEFLRFDYAVVLGFLWGIIPTGGLLPSLPRFPKRSHRPANDRTTKGNHARQEDWQQQKEDIEADLQRQKHEAQEQLRREKEQAEADLRREAERVKRAAEERVRQAEARAKASEEKARRQQNSNQTKTKDPYEVLGIPKTATKAEIKKAYRKLHSDLVF